VSSVAREAVARAEAAEAACVEKDNALTHALECELLTKKHYESLGENRMASACQKVADRHTQAIAITPAETRSVIAGLRTALDCAAEALESIPVHPDSPYWEYRKLAVQDARAAVSGAHAGLKKTHDRIQTRIPLGIRRNARLLLR